MSAPRSSSAGDGIEAHEAARRCASLSVPEIRRDAQVGKQSSILEHVADTPGVRAAHRVAARLSSNTGVIERYGGPESASRSPAMALTRVLFAAARGAAEQRHHPPVSAARSMHPAKKDPRRFLDRYAEHQRPQQAVAPGVRTTLTTAGHSVLGRTRCPPGRAAAVSPPGVLQSCI